MSNLELKPCPFCGEEPIAKYGVFDDPNDPNDLSVACQNYECEFHYWWVKPGVWNNRPIEDELIATVEIFKRKLKDLMCLLNF